MFMITEKWIMIPQPLYYALLITGALAALTGLGLLLCGIVKKRGAKRLVICSTIIAAGITLFAAVFSQKIVGGEMVGGKNGEYQSCYAPSADTVSASKTYKGE